MYQTEFRKTKQKNKKQAQVEALALTGLYLAGLIILLINLI